MSQDLLFPKDTPPVPRSVIRMLDEAFPLKDVLRMEDENGLYFQKGIHHVIEFLRARSENPDE